MKSLTITSPDEIFNKTIDALCFRGNYQGEEKEEFAKNELLKVLGETVKDFERWNIRNVVNQQLQSAIEQAESQINATAEFIQITVQTE